MILVDYSSAAIASIMPHIKDKDFTLELGKHCVLNYLRSFNVKFRNKYGVMVICCDDKASWRKELYPHYKANRSKSKSDIDWTFIYQIMNETEKDIREVFPWCVVKCPTCEGDDVIASLAHTTNEPTIIISEDKDMIQLTHFKNIEIYSHRKHKYVKNKEVDKFMFTHIIRGDTGDGVPNILSDDDTFIDDTKRQKPIRTTSIDKWYDLYKQDKSKFIESLPLNQQRNWFRNYTMVILDRIPLSLCESINDTMYNKEIYNTNVSKNKILTYFAKHKMKNLASSLADFNVIQFTPPKPQGLETFI